MTSHCLESYLLHVYDLPLIDLYDQYFIYLFKAQNVHNVKTKTYCIMYMNM